MKSITRKIIVFCIIPFALQAQPQRPNFLFFLVDDMGWADIGANGSTFQEISKKNFRPIPFLVPGKGILEAFNEQAEAIYSRILLTSEQTDALTRLRDTLLPKLLSGELRVPEAERPVAEII